MPQAKVVAESRSTISETCQSCATSKVRCIRDPETPQTCQRCLRLARECVKRQTGRRFHGFQKDRRIEALESKVRELTAAQTASGDVPSQVFACAANKLSTSTATGLDVIDQGLLGLQTAADYLQAFKSDLVTNFPFVVVPPQTSAPQLRIEKPFLFLAILASASYKNLSLQRSLGAELRKVVALRMIMGGESSFDLLQGLLVYLAWSHYHTKPQRFTQYLQLAISLIIELRLDRPPTTISHKTPLRFEPKFDFNNRSLNRPAWGNDEKRAVAGCYYLSSTVSILLHKHNSFPYFPYLGECIQSLQNQAEYTHDHIICHLVQLQQLAEKIDRFSTSNGEELIKPGSGSEMYLSSLKSDLQTLHKRLPSNFEDTRPLGMAFYATSLGLYQLSLSMFNRRREQNINPSEIQYDEMACAAINSAEALLDLYLSLPAGLEVGFTNSMWIQTAFAMLIAYRHTAAMATSTQAVALLRTLSQLRERLEGLSTSAVDMNGDRDTFVDFRSRVSRIEERLISHTAMQEQTSEHTPHPDETFVGGMGGTPVAEDFGGTMSYDGMLLNPEVGCGMANDFLFTASLDQIMSSWL